MTTTELRAQLEQQKGRRDQVAADLEDSRQHLRQRTQRGGHLEAAQALVQAVAQRTQQELEYRISELVSLALEAVFPEPYRLRLRFELRRGRSEADLLFEDSRGNEIEPLGNTGGGCVDVAALALRGTMWSLRRPRLRPVIVMDEPFKNINDETRAMHRKAAEVVAELARTLGLQFIIVTQMPELWEVADKRFHVTQRDGKSKVEEG